MFNIEQAVARWRQKMLHAGIKAPVPLDELDSHLRDAFNDRLKTGEDAEQAFDAAVSQLGDTKKLTAEFEKVTASKAPSQKWGDAQVDLAYGIFLAIYVVAIASSLAFSSFSTKERAWGFAALAAIPILYFIVRWAVRRFCPIIFNKRIASAIIITCAALSFVWFVLFEHLILPRFESSRGEVLDAVLWAIIPVLISPKSLLMVADGEQNQTFATVSSS